MDVAAGLAAVTQALSVLKGLSEIDKAYDAAQYKLQITEVKLALSDAKEALIDAREALLEKDSQIDQLRKQFAFGGTLIEKNGFKYTDNGHGEPTGLPFCPRCEVVDGRFLRLSSASVGPTLQCPQCKSKYNDVWRY